MVRYTCTETWFKKLHSLSCLQIWCGLMVFSYTTSTYLQSSLSLIIIQRSLQKVFVKTASTVVNGLTSSTPPSNAMLALKQVFQSEFNFYKTLTHNFNVGGPVIYKSPGHSIQFDEIYFSYRNFWNNHKRHTP